MISKFNLKSESLFYYLFIVLLFSIPFIEIKIIGITINPFLLLIICYFIFDLVINKNRSLKFKVVSNKILILMIAIFLVMCFSVSYSIEKKLAISETLRFLSYIISFYIIQSRCINSIIKIEKIMYVFLLQVVTISIFGIIQYFTLIGLRPEYINTLGGKIRICATYDNPNAYGAYLLLAIFPIVIMIFNESSKKLKIMYSIAFLLVGTNIFMTGSRNAYLGMALGVVLLIIFYDKRFSIIGILLVVLSLCVPAINRRILDFGNTEQNIQRFKLWNTAIHVIKDHLFFGVGNGNFVSVYDSYVKKFPELAYRDYSRYTTHNAFLKIQSELGVPGTLIFAILFIYIIFRIYKVHKISNNNMIKSFYNGFFVSIIVFYIMNLFDNLFFVPKIAYIFWIFIAIGDKIISIKSREE